SSRRRHTRSDRDWSSDVCSSDLALCQTGDFDLLFLDIFMPGMDGFETMRMVRQHQPQIPIIVSSGRPISSEADTAPDFLTMATRSEERRVGKACRCRRWRLNLDK